MSKELFDFYPMSSVTIIVGIAIFMVVLVCYAFVSQGVQQRKEQKRRLLSMLKSRSRTFKYMLSGFPPGFLSRELTMLVQRSLAEVSEQLAKLEPEEPAHMQDFQLASNALSSSSKQQGKPQAPTKLESHQKIKEVKACLDELHKFIARLEEQSTVSPTQATAHRTQIRNLVTGITIDGYELHANKAVQQEKLKLAIHYFELALKLLAREGKGLEGAQKRLETLRAKLAEVREAAKEAHPELSQSEINEQADIEAQWDKMSSGEDLWKKKNVYD